MCINKILNNVLKWTVELCNGSLYSIDTDDFIDDEDKKNERKFYGEYEMKKKDLIADNPTIINMGFNTYLKDYNDREKNLSHDIMINEWEIVDK